MTDIRDIHREAMRFASQALVARLEGNLSEATKLFEQALKKEVFAAENATQEPARSLLYRSAASLAVECGNIDQCVRLAIAGLSGHPPDDIASELMDIIDFASPHRYSPDAPAPNDVNNEHAIITIRDTIRVDTTKPLMLEEFGAPTDPVQNSAALADGDRSQEDTNPRYCRYLDVITATECIETAPGLIERVINDFKQGGYAGYSAFMLADMIENNQTGDPPANCGDLPSDIFTGLYAVGRGHPPNGCGGTINNAPGTLKNTGYRICGFYWGREQCYATYIPIKRR